MLVLIIAKDQGVNDKHLTPENQLILGRLSLSYVLAIHLREGETYLQIPYCLMGDPLLV